MNEIQKLMVLNGKLYIIFLQKFREVATVQFSIYETRTRLQVWQHEAIRIANSGAKSRMY
jgi:hypothetical protein